MRMSLVSACSGTVHLATTLLLVIAGIANAAEPPSEAGLLLRLDAAEQSAARQKAGLPALLNLRSVDRWLSTANGPAAALQPLPSGRPICRLSDNEAFFRFDGKDDFLAISGSRRLA